MLIKYYGKGIRTPKSDNFEENDNWKFKPLYSIFENGFELVYTEECEITNISDTLCSMKFDLKIKTKYNYNIIIFPHSNNIGKPVPTVMTQTIETDWWPKSIEIILERGDHVFKKGDIIAEGLCMPRRECIIKEMEEKEKKQIDEACEFLDNNENKYITRSNPSNLYEVLSNLALRGQLPEELKEKKPMLGSRLKRI